MFLNKGNLDGLFDGFKMNFNQGFTGVDSLWSKIAMKVTSTTREEHYAWLEKLPYMREWLGPRHITGLAASGFSLANRDWEQTISVPRNDIQDDKYGLFAPLFMEMGRVAAEQPDRMVVDALLSGFTRNCYDGQFFFDADHPIEIDETTTVSASNMQAGAGEPWFLLDTSKAIRPFVYQERVAFGRLDRMDEPNDHNVFMNKEFLYGSDGRGAAGYGLWQLAFGSKDTLDAENYRDARAAMASVVGANGRKLGVRGTTLLVGPTNEERALKLLNSELASGGESNPWKGTAQLIVSPWI